MIRNLKALGLALVAVLAMSAMAASAASAEKSYRTANAPANLHGTQVAAAPTIFHFPGAGSLECSSVFTGSQATTAASTLTVRPDYTGCKGFGFATMHVTENGCHYTFTTPTTHSGVVTAQMHVGCGASPITLTPTFLGSSVCSLTIGSHTPGGGVDFTNEAGKVRATMTLTNVSHSAGCGASAASDGTFTGQILFEGNNGAISVS